MPRPFKVTSDYPHGQCQRLATPPTQTIQIGRTMCGTMRDYSLALPQIRTCPIKPFMARRGHAISKERERELVLLLL